MTTKNPQISVYLGDIHGSRLAPMKQALSELEVQPNRLLCTMDLDQVLSMHELREYEVSFDLRGFDALVVPGNHEDALVSGIAIDSGTYREEKQETTIHELAERLNRVENRSLRSYVETKLRIRGGLRLQLSEVEDFPAVIIHGALCGKEERYLHEFPAQLQAHVKARGDLWLRLETGDHIRGNFAVMRDQGIRTMFRGHDHFVAMRSIDSAGCLYAHDVVINEFAGERRCKRRRARRDDGADVVESVTSAEISVLGSCDDFHWMPLHPERQHVINFGPYFVGYFGLVRAAADGKPPAVAFCRIETSHYTAADRARLLSDTGRGIRTRSSTSFYDRFSQFS